MQEDFIPKEEELLDLDCGLLTPEHRRRIHQQNLVIWGMSYFLLVPCMVDV
jgi:hypothetical protein